MGAGASSTPTAPQADGAWKAGQWMATLKNSKGLSICDILGDAVCDAANQADQLSVLRSLGEEDDSTKIAERVKGELCEIVDVIFQGTKQLNSTKFATTQEYNEKYMQAPGGFTLSYGGLDNFYGGLESQVGSPSPNFIAAMHQEHCEATDSDKDFTTGNYGVTTTSRTEFAFVFGLDGGATAAKSTLFEEFQRMVHEFSETVQVEAQDEGIVSQKDFVDLCEQQLKKLQQAQRDDVSWPCESTSMLKELNLSGLSDKAGAAVAIALTRAGGARVRILKFTENDFSGQAACALGRLLASNSTFLELILFGCQIGDEAGAELLQALARRTGAASPLRVLWLNKNDFGAGSAASRRGGRAAGGHAAGARAAHARQECLFSERYGLDQSGVDGDHGIAPRGGVLR
eukprot:CAMPEP_0177501068 /NCGR_PEP_ID=MMETSP0369-20130122/37012_1 /TAXON_ID=447022 ORGANISM="Scrippsiella hangoei-like, Strain SHHI-4" /NCGR_SAMPLE_ID=MMETSP0369 /ASSEMBLY_ACC=CAM_ASM_000364 /LENGTH=401 /DNA_ID=CAMNT_0018978519 /DNA_START=30 /DNA_END=1232 /DNA_ORIENTATION=-